MWLFIIQNYTLWSNVQKYFTFLVEEINQILAYFPSLSCHVTIKYQPRVASLYGPIEMEKKTGP